MKKYFGSFLTVVFWCAPALSLEVNIGTLMPVPTSAVAPSSDATSLIQGLINTGTAVVLPCGATTNVTGLTKPPTSMPVSIRGECPSAVLHVTANAPAIDCTNFSAPFVVYNLTITGTGATYTGYGTGPSDAGQHGFHINNCPKARGDWIEGEKLSGNLIDYENSSFAFSDPRTPSFSNISGTSNYRVIYTHGYGEYATFSNINGRANVFGAEIASGNINFSNSNFDFNSIGVKISGSATNGNPCHGSFVGGSINHNTYNLVAMSCGLGETFSGVNFVGDQSGGLAAGVQEILIYNSRGIVFIGGQLGSNAVTVQADPSTGDTSLAGINSIQGMVVREDLTNFTCPSGGYTVSGSSSWAIKTNLKLTGVLSTCNN